MKISWRMVPVMVLATLAGCAAKQHRSAEQYFGDASESFRAGALPLAVDELHELLDQYPFSQYNEEAELKIAHAQYLEANYPEAVVTLSDFQRRHPTSAYLPFVGYLLGMCYVQQMGTIDRDQSASQNALSYFLTVAQQYPTSPFADLARQELARCQEELAAHELYVAEFYSTRGNDKAAEVRLLTLASRYGDTLGSATGLLRLAKLYRKQHQREYAVLAYEAVAQQHPGTPEAASARQALRRMRVEAAPTSNDPLDVLLAANGRQRSTGSFETVQVPGLEPSRTARRPSSPSVPALGPSMDPFGRGSGRPY